MSVTRREIVRFYWDTARELAWLFVLAPPFAVAVAVVSCWLTLGR